MIRRRVAILSLVIWQALSIGMVWSQVDGDAKSDAPLDPTGTWKWQYQFGDTAMDAKLKLNWDGKRLTGKYTARDATTEIRDAKQEKDEVTFVTTRTANGNTFDVRFAGKVADDEIVGTVTLDFGGEPREFDWHAKRAVETDDILGTWDLKLETPNGVIEPRLTISKTADDKLLGTYVSVFGEREPKNLKLKDNELTWEISSNDGDDFDFEIVYKGKPRGNRITGTNEYDFSGSAGTMEFTGKRTPPKEDKEDGKSAAATPSIDVEPAQAADAATDAAEAESAAPATSDSQPQQ